MFKNRWLLWLVLVAFNSVQVQGDDFFKDAIRERDKVWKDKSEPEPNSRFYLLQAFPFEEKNVNQAYIDRFVLEVESIVGTPPIRWRLALKKMISRTNRTIMSNISFNADEQLDVPYKSDVVLSPNGTVSLGHHASNTDFNFACWIEDEVVALSIHEELYFIADISRISANTKKSLWQTKIQLETHGRASVGGKWTFHGNLDVRKSERGLAIWYSHIYEETAILVDWETGKIIQYWSSNLAMKR